MRKLISWIAVGILLIFVPLGSWFYLKQGLDYRKNALEELKPKDNLDSIPDSLNVFKYKTTLLVLKENEKILNSCDLIYDQFKDAFTFQIVGNINKPYAIPFSHKILSSLKGGNASFAIIDTSLQIRNLYSTETKDLKKMVEHLAIVIPRIKEKDIKTK
ncbi:MAG: hypothetical protein IPN49_00520 [Saprospiraceae bacterium]|nr:hypothetical protein [Saprospiraceae bacterium]